MSDYRLIIEDFKKFLRNHNSEKSNRLIKKSDAIESFDEFEDFQMELHYSSLYNAFN